MTGKVLSGELKDNKMALTKNLPQVSVGTNSGTKLKLWVLDRMVIGNLFPEKASLEDQICAKSISNKVVLVQDEATDVALTMREGRASWNQQKEFSKVFDFTVSEINFLKDQVQRLDNEKGIKIDMIDLCLSIKEVKLEK